MTTAFNKLRDCLLLTARTILGVAFIFHGWPKIKGGPNFWHGLGGMVLGPSLANSPIATPLGFIGALIEFGGGILLILGAGFRWVCLFLFLQMCAALFLVHLRHGDGFMVYSHPLEDAAAFLALMAAGPGKCSVDEKCCKSAGETR
jgi:putative oxidoreductase